MKKLLVLALTLGFSMFFVASAFAILPGQQACTDQQVTNTNPDFPLIVQGSQVQVRNGLLPAKCILTFSAESTISEGDFLSIEWSIDGGPCTELNSCPEIFNIFGNLSFVPVSNTIQCVTLLGPGVHNVAPCLEVTDENYGGGVQGTLYRRCLTIECQTK